MKNTMGVFLGFLFFAVLFPVKAWAGEMAGSFSADVVTSSPQGVISMKMYSAGQKSRMEMAESIMIVRNDLNIMWMVMPSQGMYMEQPIDPAMVARTSRTMPGEIERLPQGSELINGKMAKKFKITYEAAGKRDSMYQWIGDNEIPVRTQAIDGSWTVDFKNISTAAVPDSLFEAPAGYRKFAMPSMDNMLAAAGVGDQNR